MIDLSPQLQSKVFDTLLFHMKEERKGGGAGAAAATLKGAAKGRTARGRTKASRGPQGGGVVDAGAWTRLAEDLRRLGLDKTTADALVSWANSQAEHSRQSPVKIRVLHPMEREFISVAAYDYLLDLYRLGLLDPNSLETLLENCAYLTSLPASKEQVQKLALRSFAEALESAGLGSSH